MLIRSLPRWLSLNENGLKKVKRALFAVLVSVMALLQFDPFNAHAASFDARAGFGYTNTESESENRTTGETGKTSFTSRNQDYSLYFLRDFFPYLTFSGGGNFNIQNSESGFGETRTTTEATSIRPYLELRLENPFIQAGVGYQDSEASSHTRGTTKTTNFSTTHYSFLSLRPDRLPELDLSVSRTDRSNDPETVDRVENNTSIHSRYSYRGLTTDYSYTENTNEDKLNDFQIRSRGHDAKIRYNRGYLDGKVNMSTGYWIAYSRTDLEGSGSALAPVLRWSGLYSLDMTPEDGPALASISGLIDGDREAPTSLDIGLAGDETTLTNIGVDIGFPTEVDTIHIWVDRQLTPEVSDSFTWYVYTSPDNTDSSDWQLHATISPGDFGVFDNRFEISFPSIETKFIKVAVAPLLGTVPGASGFPNIFVTEMEIFTTLTSQDEFSTLNQRFDHSIGWRVSDMTAVGYNWRLHTQNTDPEDVETASMSNGLFVNHTFNEIFTGSVNVSRVDRHAPNVRAASDNYSASLGARYIEAFRQTLTLNAARSYDNLSHRKNYSLFLKNNADLYRGVSVYLDTGMNWGEVDDGENSRSTVLRAGSSLDPNDKVSMNLDYRVSRSHISGQETSLRETGSFKTFVLPSRYLSLSARLQFDKSDDTNRTSQKYDLNWNPSLGGSLQFFLTYSQDYESEGDAESSTVSPGLRWRIAPGASLRAAYSQSETKSNTELLDSKSLAANLSVRL